MGSRETVLGILCALALDAAADKNVDRSSYLLDAILSYDDDDFPALTFAMLTWIDALREHIAGGRQGILRLSGLPVVADRNGNRWVLGSAAADMNLPEHVTWATAAIEARLQGDVQRWNRLIDDAPDDVDGFARYVYAVLALCATTIKAMPRGSALR